ncbi:MAG: hypothetical protein IEMM0002_1115 [bacterium]|nr:MAG: hypothetical protein IEMM0002_1115 [bacterium]
MPSRHQVSRHRAYGEWVKRTVTSDYGPAELTIHSTGRCNLECFMCWHGMVRKIPVNIEPEKLDPFLQKAERVLFSGGEPLWMTRNVNKAAGEIFDRIISKYPRIKLNTLSNGVLLDEKKALLVLKRFESICFSVDTLNPAVYEKVRGKRLLDVALSNIKNLDNLKKRAGRSRNDEPFMIMNSVVMNSTLEGMPGLVEKFSNIGGLRHILSKLEDVLDPMFDYFRVRQYLRGENSESETERIVNEHDSKVKNETFGSDKSTKARIKRVSVRLRKICSSTGMEIEDKSRYFAPRLLPAPSEPESVCPLPWTQAYIHQNGDVYFCCTNSVLLGNLGRNDFGEIWNGKTAREVRASFVKGEMKGCIRDSCDSLIDYPGIAESYSERLYENLGGIADGANSVLMLLTAPIYQSYLSVKSIMLRFPAARLTVVTNSGGVRDGFFCGGSNNSSSTKALAYPADFFKPGDFKDWWAQNGDRGVYSLVAAVCNNDSGSGYANVNEILRNIDANKRIFIKPTGDVTEL